MRSLGPNGKTVAIVVATSVVAAGALWVGALDWAERQSLSARYSLRTTRVDGRIATVSFDRETFRKAERNVLPRSWLADAVRWLRNAGATAIVIDVDLAFPSKPDREDQALYAAIDAGPHDVVVCAADVVGFADPDVPKTLEGLANIGIGVFFRDGNHGKPRPGAQASQMEYSAGGVTSCPIVAVNTSGERRIEDRDLVPRPYIDFPDHFSSTPIEAIHERTAHAGAFHDRIAYIAPTRRSDIESTPIGTITRARLGASQIHTALGRFPLRPAPDWSTAVLILLMATMPPVLLLRMFAPGRRRRAWLFPALSVLGGVLVVALLLVGSVVSLIPASSRTSRLRCSASSSRPLRAWSPR